MLEEELLVKLAGRCGVSPCWYVGGRDLVSSINSPGVKVASQRQKSCTMGNHCPSDKGKMEKETVTCSVRIWFVPHRPVKPNHP